MHTYHQIYYLIKFKLKEYIEFLDIKNINQCQRNKYINLFYSFQKMKSWIIYFTDVNFQNLLGFPYLTIQKQRNSWVVKVAILKLLYKSNHSFSFPNNFLRYEDIYNLHIELKVTETISIILLEKVFYV